MVELVETIPLMSFDKLNLYFLAGHRRCVAYAPPVWNILRSACCDGAKWAMTAQPFGLDDQFAAL